jgi:proline iminopeptidase
MQVMSSNSMTLIGRLSCLLLIAAFSLAGCASQQPLPDDGFVDVPGGRVASRVVGGGDAVPVLLIHGGPGGTSCAYASTVGGVASSRPVVLYDQLGSGNSDKMLDLKRDAVLPRFVQEVQAIREQLGLKEVHLVGHSWGATVALEYLLTANPTGVRSVSFVGPLLSTPRWIQDANGLVRQLPPDVQDAIQTAKSTGNYDTPEFRAANEVFEANFGVRTPREQRQRLPLCASTPVRFNAQLYEYMWGPSEFVSDGTLRDYDRVGQLSVLKLPTLFVVGEYDEARPETVREFQKHVPGSIVRIIPGAGHGVTIDQTQAFNDVITEFISGVDLDNLKQRGTTLH